MRFKRLVFMTGCGAPGTGAQEGLQICRKHHLLPYSRPYNFGVCNKIHARGLSYAIASMRLVDATSLCDVRAKTVGERGVFKWQIGPTAESHQV